MRMDTYDVKVTREDRWWMIEIPALDGLTQARRLSEVEDQARSYIATDLDVALSAVSLGAVSIVVDGADYAMVRAEIADLRAAAQKAEHEAAALAQSTARALAAEEIPMRDIGTLLGISHQRVHQLIAT